MMLVTENKTRDWAVQRPLLTSLSERLLSRMLELFPTLAVVVLHVLEADNHCLQEGKVGGAVVGAAWFRDAARERHQDFYDCFFKSKFPGTR
jgi:hypothetical protein